MERWTAAFGRVGESAVKAVLKTYENLDVPVRFTWTNSELEESHLSDPYCNRVMMLASNGVNQVLCNSPALEEYIRENYPDFEFVSSTTKRILSLDEIKAELSKKYVMTVLDYDLNHNEEVLKALEPDASRVEILVDEICYPGCTKRCDHYKAESLAQLAGRPGKPFDCPNTMLKADFEICKSRPAFISNEELPSYIERGFVNFKLVGRGLPVNLVKDSLMYYLVKEEERDFIRYKIDDTLNKILGK